MKKEILQTFDKKQIQIYIWDQVNETKGIIQLVHGSCEHALRYNDFANRMNKKGWIVVGNDHRGHGQTAKLNNQTLGFFSSKNGWNKIVNDLDVVNEFIKTNYKNLPIVMLGHSMGSFMARTYMIDYLNKIDGYIISGTAWYPKFLLQISLLIAKFRQSLRKNNKEDRFIWKLSYKKLNKRFENKNSTGVEWLSNDDENNDNFIKDPLTGQIFTSAAFKDMFSGLIYNQKKSNLKRINKEKPIFLISGLDDSVGSYGKSVKKTNKMFEQQKLNVKMKLYEKQRHEILFDINKEKVEEDILKFLSSIK
ncbi:lysophospholipase [Mesoplasma chauliocola]|uniref:Lysophospholipase n=1 Tax=Mesoplasma chauliocola TaxID=216427 RepID=A0A249SM82_9MOLU|nr:alpha/beta fold hydrolase [Mesoplasma chauliocola]ASZ08756.1 lysophospholipase [Mesoplasma chauliocola]